MSIPKHMTGGHWYNRAGDPCHFVEKKDGSGFRPTTLADARKNGWLPSVTTITKVLAAPALVEWKVRNAIEAALTTPRIEGETLDQFADRVMEIDAESIGKAARDLGTEVHQTIEDCMDSKPYNKELESFVAPAVAAAFRYGIPYMSEQILVGEKYAGKVDVVMQDELGNLTVVDFKTTKAKTLPKKSYVEHRLQLAAYAKVIGSRVNKTVNIYISTINPGEVSITENEWVDDFVAFSRVVDVWYWQNNYEVPK